MRKYTLHVAGWLMVGLMPSLSACGDDTPVNPAAPSPVSAMSTDQSATGTETGASADVGDLGLINRSASSSNDRAVMNLANEERHGGERLTWRAPRPQFGRINGYEFRAWKRGCGQGNCFARFQGGAGSHYRYTGIGGRWTAHSRGYNEIVLQNLPAGAYVFTMRAKFCFGDACGHSGPQSRIVITVGS